MFHVLEADIYASTSECWCIVLAHRCWLNVNDVGCCDTTLLTPCNWGLPRHGADLLRAAGWREGRGNLQHFGTTTWKFIQILLLNAEANLFSLSTSIKMIRLSVDN